MIRGEATLAGDSYELLSKFLTTLFFITGECSFVGVLFGVSFTEFENLLRNYRLIDFPDFRNSCSNSMPMADMRLFGDKTFKGVDLDPRVFDSSWTGSNI